jgi:hypothetical protein
MQLVILSISGQEIGLEQGTATFHKIRASLSFLQKRALFYWSLWSESGLRFIRLLNWRASRPVGRASKATGLVAFIYFLPCNLVCWSLTWVKSNSQARKNKILYLPNVDNRLMGWKERVERTKNQEPCSRTKNHAVNSARPFLAIHRQSFLICLK